MDEMGPIAVKTYPGETWEPGTNRATFEPGLMVVEAKYGFMAPLNPATGQAEIINLSTQRQCYSY